MALDKPLSAGQMLENVGYSKNIAKTPSTVLESEGFKASLAEFGLTEELITTSLVEDIKAKPEKRTSELKLGAEILGMVKREEKPPSNNTNTYNFIFDANVQEKIKDVNDQIKNLLINPPDVQSNQEEN